jgi:multiple sugar transport system substrate-binding protein
MVLMPQRFRNAFCITALSFCLISLFTGCSKEEKNLDPRPKFWQSVEPGGKFTLWVVGDAEVAKKIRQVAGTWEELTQTSLTVEETTVEALLAGGQKPTADALICPMELQATLVQLGYPAKISTAIHQAGGELWGDLLDTYRMKLSRFGPDVMFVPLGAQFFVCYYRIDLLQQIREQPPENWADYEHLRVKLQNLGEDRTNWIGALEPTAPGWAGYAFLARAASYATHRDYFSTLFDVRTMSPRIATEPFVRALAEMQSANPPGTPRYTVDEVRRAFWQGETAMAITWPTAATIYDRNVVVSKPMLLMQTVKSNEPEFKAGVAMIPGSTLAFNTEKKIWDDRRRDEASHIPTLVTGLVGMVSESTSDQVGMFKLLLWLSGKEWGTEVFAASPNAGISRKSGVEQISRWVEKEAMNEHKMRMDYISLLSKHWSANEAFVVPSLPGYAEYMAALDREVGQVLDGHKEPQVALDEVARQWEAITAQYGIDSQRRLYRLCCGLVGE